MNSKTKQSVSKKKADKAVEAGKLVEGSELNVQVASEQTPISRKPKKSPVSKTAVTPSTEKRGATSLVKKAVATKRSSKKKAQEPVAVPPEAHEAATNIPVIEEIVLEKVQEVSPVFKKLAQPKLPELKRENRSQLQMQTPTRLFFYWSLKADPWRMLRNAFGNESGSFTLVLKLKNLTDKTEEMHPVDAVGNWWFNVAAGSEYQAEIGFYSIGRPYFRVVYSNKIETPRRTPSPRPASESQWMTTAEQFSGVLEAAGFVRDAYEVALAGDDQHSADTAAHAAFKQLTGVSETHLDGLVPADLRSAMVSIASGVTDGELQSQVGPRIFGMIEQADAIDVTKASRILSETFGSGEFEIEEEIPSPAVHGASLVHFPRGRRSSRAALPSSHTFGRPSSSKALLK